MGRDTKISCALYQTIEDGHAGSGYARKQEAPIGYCQVDSMQNSNRWQNRNQPDLFFYFRENKMNALKRALAIAAIPATMAAAPAGAEVLFDNTNTVGETPEYMGVAAYYPDLDAVVSSVFLFSMDDPTESHGGFRISFDGFVIGLGLFHVSMMRVGSLGTETICDSDGFFCSEQSVYSPILNTKSDTKTINFMPGAGHVTVDFDGYNVHGGTYAILIGGVRQGTIYNSFSLYKTAPESIIGRYTGAFSSSPDLTTFYQKTDGIYTSDVGVAFKIETLPVPEPENYAMFLAGLGLVGLAARKRMGAAPSASI